MQIHSALRNGFKEVFYQQALAMQIEYQGLQFEREKSIEIGLLLNFDAHSLQSKRVYNNKIR